MIRGIFILFVLYVINHNFNMVMGCLLSWLWLNLVFVAMCIERGED